MKLNILIKNKMFKDINNQFQIMNCNKKLKINNFTRMQYKVTVWRETHRKSLKIQMYKIPKSHKVHLKLQIYQIRFQKLNIKTNLKTLKV